MSRRRAGAGRRLGVAGVVLAALVGIGIVFVRTAPPVVGVEPGTPVEAVARAHPGATLRLLGGWHDAFEVHDAVTIVAEPGAVVAGPIRIAADGVRLDGLTVVGGESAITVRDADDVAIVGATVRGAELHGIEVIDGTARIEGCRISGLTSSYAQGIEIRNANGRGRSVVRGCAIDGGQEGLVSHVSRVEFLDNVVTGTTQRGITVTEMSEGLVEANLVRDAIGSAVFCGDMSHCEIRRNRFERIDAAPGGPRSAQGWGVVGLFYATLRSTDNAGHELGAGPLRLSSDSVAVETFPLGVWPAGWRGLWPGGAVAVAAAGLAVGATVGPARVMLRRRRGTERGSAPYGDGVVGFVVAAVGVQAFHMLEHVVQVWQVYVVDAEIRSGLLGRAVDTEWVHFTYNFAVLGFAAWLAAAAARGRFGNDVREGPALAFLVAAAAIQTYHFAEHVAKIVQHEALALDPAPGIVGADLGLVWFHFAINLAVFAALVVGATPLLRRNRLVEGVPTATHRRVPVA